MALNIFQNTVEEASRRIFYSGHVMWTKVLLMGVGGGQKWGDCYEGVVVICKGRERQSCFVCSVLHCGTMRTVWFKVMTWMHMLDYHTKLETYGN